MFVKMGSIEVDDMTPDLNGAKYREILDENLLQSTQDLRLGQRFTFQQDNAPEYTAVTTKEWLRGKSVFALSLWGIVCRLMRKKCNTF